MFRTIHANVCRSLPKFMTRPTKQTTTSCSSWTWRLKTVHQHLSYRQTTTMAEASSQADQRTAGIIIIGDEILKGQTQDTNSHFICKHLFGLGVKVKRISVVLDDLDTIAQEVALFSKNYTHVITSGGIGPTHDDLTFEGVAKAFGEPLVAHPDLVQLIKKFFGTEDLQSPKMKMAYVPKSAELKYGEDKNTGKKTLYPLVVVRNVYIFPGVPSILENAFLLLSDLFQNPSVEFNMREVYCKLDEMSITQVLNAADEKFKVNVILGSYPDFHNSYYKVKLTLESQNKEHLDEAYRFLTENLPAGCVMDYDKEPIRNSADRVYGLLKNHDLPESFRSNLQKAISVVEECLERYSLDEICVGFNGGKDCTALLHLCHAVFKRKYPDHGHKLKALYIRSKMPFPEVEKFIQISRDNYQLEMVTYSGRIKECLSEMKTDHPKLQAVLMGTRRTDPYSSHLEFFSMTDPDWPQYMRVNPLIEWAYEDVWCFIRQLCLPYCNLYDKGYTSLGSMNNTHPNPILQYTDDRGVVCYKPAYLLPDSGKERDGRNV